MLRLETLSLLLVMLLMSATLADDLPKSVAAAEEGDFDAMLNVGLAYLADDAEANNADGIKWLEMSSAGGNIIAYYNLGTNYQDGGSVKKDPQKAIMYLTIAAELGEERAMNRLAGIYYLGEIVPANDTLAVKWALCAMGLGNERAKKNLEDMKSQVSERDLSLGAKAALEWAKRRQKETAK